MRMAHASLGRLPTLLQVAAVLCIVIASAQAQVTEFGQCENYQTATTFTEEYIAGMTAEKGGYVVTLTSGRPYSCQDLVLHDNNTFTYTTHDPFNTLQNYTGPFKANVSSYVSPGFIDLSLPPGVFGASLTSGLRLRVLMAEPDYLLVASCVSVLGVARSEQVIALVPRSKFNVTTARTLNETLVNRKVPGSHQFHRVIQKCTPYVRGISTVDILNLMIFLGKVRVPYRRHLLYGTHSEPITFGVDDDVKILTELTAKANPSEMRDLIKSVIYSPVIDSNNISPETKSLLQILRSQFPQSNANGEQVDVTPYTGSSSPSGQLNNLQPISYSGPYFSNAQPVYVNPTANGINVSPAFVQQFGSTNNVPTAAFEQPLNQANNLPFTNFAQQPTQFGSASSTGFEKQAAQFGYAPSTAFAQQPSQFGNVPYTAFAQQPSQFGNVQYTAFAQQSSQFGYAPSTAFAQQPAQFGSESSAA